ncbi:MAG: DUF11 domain-containing protein, partial [Chloroflexaceae bacterium]|nr:DUF11 domain-containing protein [Chloroflexaceae bacterium]
GGRSSERAAQPAHQRATPGVTEPILEIVVEAQGQVAPGTILRFTITFRNNGNAVATNVQIRFTAPDGTEFIDERSSDGWQLFTGVQQSPNEYIFPIGDLEPGESGEVTFVVQVDPATAEGTIFNTMAVIESAEVPAVEAETVETLVAMFRNYMPRVTRAADDGLGDARADLVGTLRLVPNKTTFAAGEPVRIELTITNQGDAPTESGFWVDLYINPARTPEANLIWPENCGLFPCHGIVWPVNTQLEPGESITLTSDDIAAEYSVWPGWFVNGTTDIYAYLDVYGRDDAANGAIDERDETNNLVHLPGLTVTGENPPLLQEALPALTERPELP